MCIDSSENVIMGYEYFKLSNLYFFQFAHASCGSRRGVMVGSPVSRSSWNILTYQDIVLRSWTRYFTVTVPLSIYPGGYMGTREHLLLHGVNPVMD